MRKIKILIAEDEEILRDVIEMILESEIDAEYLKMENGEDAEIALRANSDIDLIISDYNMPIKSGGDLFVFNSKQKNLPFILASGGFINDYPQFKNYKEMNPLNVYIEKPYDAKNLIDSVKNIIHFIAKNETEEVEKNIQAPILKKENVELIKVKLAHFMKYAKDANDVFLSLTPNKFVKISDENPNTKPGNEVLSHYLNKKIEYVYITKENFNNLIKSYKANLLNFQKPEETIELAGHAFSLSIKCLETMGISEHQLQQTNDIVEATIKDITSSKGLVEKYKTICDNEGFIVGHSLLLVYLAGGIISKTQLHYQNTMKKICMAAFVHDMSLIDDELAKLELKLEMCETKEIKAKVLNHVFESAKLLQDSEELFEETKKIIIEHHEKPDGSGYPKGINGNNTFHLSALFILCHDIAIEIIKNNYSNENIGKFLKEKEAYYSVGQFTKYYQLAIKQFS